MCLYFCGFCFLVQYQEKTPLKSVIQVLAFLVCNVEHIVRS